MTGLQCERARRVVAVAASALLPSLASAQVMASEKGSVSQTVDGTTITIEYSRPVARGRSPFPDVVRYGRPWTPGANWATTLEVDAPVHINGNPLPKGTYGVWMIAAHRGSTSSRSTGSSRERPGRTEVRRNGSRDQGVRVLEREFKDSDPLIRRV